VAPRPQKNVIIAASADLRDCSQSRRCEDRAKRNCDFPLCISGEIPRGISPPRRDRQVQLALNASGWHRRPMTVKLVSVSLSYNGRKSFRSIMDERDAAFAFPSLIPSPRSLNARVFFSGGI